MRTTPSPSTTETGVLLTEAWVHLGEASNSSPLSRFFRSRSRGAGKFSVKNVIKRLALGAQKALAGKLDSEENPLELPGPSP
jgi:hypothetical protein